VCAALNSELGQLNKRDASISHIRPSKDNSKTLAMYNSCDTSIQVEILEAPIQKKDHIERSEVMKFAYHDKTSKEKKEKAVTNPQDDYKRFK
jgi:hypothetical protein